MRNVAVLVVLALLAVSPSSCATIVSKSDWPISIRSAPDQADVTIMDSTGQKIFQGKTPTVVTLSSNGGYFKGKNYTVTVGREGYQEQTVPIVSSLNGWFIGNLLFGGLIGFLIVDPLTGAMWTLDPSEINLTLSQKTGALDQEQRTLRVLTLQDVPLELQGKLVRIQ
jgi:hypothetical protein